MVYDPLTEVIDEPLIVTNDTVDRLRAFRHREPKLRMLPGVDVTKKRVFLTTVLNDLADRLVLGIQTHPRKLWVLSEFQRSLELVELEDTEEREHFGMELEEIMNILGIESSDGLLACYLGGI